MSHSQAPSTQAKLAKLEKLYENKRLQAQKAKLISNTFMYQVLIAEAENIKSAMEQF